MSDLPSFGELADDLAAGDAVDFDAVADALTHLARALRSLLHRDLATRIEWAADMASMLGMQRVQSEERVESLWHGLVLAEQVCDLVRAVAAVAA